MSLLPLLFSAWWAELDRPHRLLDQHFGLGLYPDQLMFPRGVNHYFPSIADRAALDLYYAPLSEILKRDPGGTSSISADKDTFKVILDVQQFKPEEINVKIVDRFVVVEAKHEEKRDEHGMISRQFVRKYLLPDQVNADQLSSNISSDGVLTITAPLKQVEEKPNERTIKIEFTGKPAIRNDANTPTPKPVEVETNETKESKEDTNDAPNVLTDK